MDKSRRDALKAGGSIGLLSVLVGLGLVNPGVALGSEWSKGVFGTKNIADALKELGVAQPEMSDAIVITAPDIAENGAMVPIEAVSNIPNTQSIAYLVENNPTTVAAVFDILPGTMPEVRTRVKMAKTSNVMILVKADGKVYANQKEVKVTRGGCGG